MIRWIAPFLGTAPASSVILEAGQRLLDVRDLVDREGNPVEAVRRKIAEGLDGLRRGETVIVGCDYGISRSNAIAAGLLSAYREIPFDEAVRQVIEVTGEREIKLNPLNTVRRALAEVNKTDARELRILLTGGSGFIGSFLRPMLAEQWPVFAPSSREVDLLRGNAELDLQVKEQQITHLVHLANPRISSSNRAMGEAVTMLRNVIEVCRENDLHLTYPSSGAIYSGSCGNGVGADETRTTVPKGTEGEAKWLCELLIGHHRKGYGLRCGLLRAPVLYGAKDRPRFLGTFILGAREGKPIYTHEYRNGFPCLDLMHVSDFCRAVSASIRTGFEGDANLGTGRLISTRQVAIRVKDLLGSSSEIRTRTVDDEAPNIAMETAFARKRLSWSPAVTFEEGLIEMISPSAQRHQQLTGEFNVQSE